MDILHDIRQQKFFTIIEGKEYSLEYNEVDDNHWEFHCSIISNIVTNLKERDIRDRLIEYAVYYMSRKNIKLLEANSCLQMRDFVEKKNITTLVEKT